MNNVRRCPQCKEAVRRVVQSLGSLLNADQWNATKAGDWLCVSCPSNGRGKSLYGRYLWESEVLKEEGGNG